MATPFRISILFALAASILAGMPSLAGDVVFGDPVIEARIRFLLGIPASEGPLQASDLENLIMLDVIGFSVSDLSGLEFATNLEVLDLSSNMIADLSALAGLTSLRELRLNENVISDLTPLAGLTSLAVLELNDNLVLDIEPLVNNNGLGALDIVSLNGNPLDEEAACDDIPRLEERGVVVISDVACPGSVGGVVFDSETGDAIPCAAMVAGPLSNPGFTSTDLNGDYLFESIALGTNIVEVFAPGYTRAVRAVDVPTEELVTEDFAMTPDDSAAVRIAGLVVDALSLQPLGGVMVEARAGVARDVAFTCGTGEFLNRLGAQVTGTVTLTLAAPGFVTQERTIELEEAAKGVVAITLQPVNDTFTGGISGTVTDVVSDSPIFGARIAVKVQGGTIEFTSNTNVNGEYSVGNLPAGRYIVKASSPNHPDENDRDTVNVDADEVLRNFFFGTEPTPGSGCGARVSAEDGLANLFDLVMVVLVAGLLGLQRNRRPAG